MFRIIDREARRKIMSVLAKMKKPVKLFFFAQVYPWQGCSEQDELHRKFAPSFPKLEFRSHEMMNIRESWE